MTETRITTLAELRVYIEGLGGRITEVVSPEGGLAERIAIDVFYRDGRPRIHERTLGAIDGVPVIERQHWS